MIEELERSSTGRGGFDGCAKYDFSVSININM